MRLGTIDPPSYVAETVIPKQMPPASEGFIGIKTNGSPEQFCHAWKCPDLSPDVPEREVIPQFPHALPVGFRDVVEPDSRISFSIPV